MLTIRYAEMNLGTRSAVLDLGAGGGRHAFEAARLGHRAVAVDLNTADLLGVRQAFVQYKEYHLDDALEVDLLCGDGQALPFPDHCFDGVICSEVAEHVIDTRAMFSEIVRVTKVGGTIAVTVPRAYPELVNWMLSREYHAATGGHIRIFTKTSLRKEIERAKASVRGSHHSHALHSPYWWLKAYLGVRRSTALIKIYERALLYEMGHPGGMLTRLEHRLNPLVGKSLVVYCKRSELSGAIDGDVL